MVFIQPERGNETVYLVRASLTGRVLAAENVLSSETAVMKALLLAVACVAQCHTKVDSPAAKISPKKAGM
jgi:hypothetical protein